MFSLHVRLVTALGSLAVLGWAQAPYLIQSVTAPPAQKKEIGSTIAPAGDVDQDGASDLIVGFAFLNDVSGLSDQMSAATSANTSGFHLWTPSTGAFVRTIIEPGFAARGFAAANLGDVNGDGRPDQAVSDPTSWSGANFGGRVDAYSGLDGSVLWTFAPAVPSAQAGTSIARIADVDLDGIQDVVVGAIGASSIPGRAFVLSGATGALLRTHTGGPSDTMGWSTLDVGDLDVDGVSDYAAGAPNTAGVGTQPAGVVHVWSGATGALIRTFTGAAPQDRFGRALARAGDLNGDMVPDVWVGAPARFNLAVPGILHAIDGATGAVLLNVTRNVPGDRFGWSIAAIGDRNADGKGDVAVGTNTGIVEVRSGGFGGLIHTQSGLLNQTAANGIVLQTTALGDIDGNGQIDAAIGSPNSGENGLLAIFTSLFPSATLVGDNGQSFLSDVAVVDDLDGDGIRDLAVGDSGFNAPGFANSGTVVVRSSATGALIAQLNGTSQEERLGAAITTLDDVDLDGVEEFLVSSLSAPGGVVTCRSGASGAVLYAATGPATAVHFGFTLTRLSDLDGDGLRDFAVGAPYTPLASGPTTGQVFLCSGATGAIFLTINGLTGSEFFGVRIAEIGDVTGDGIEDIVVGAPYASSLGLPTAGVARVISGASGAIVRTHTGTAPGIACGNGLCGLSDLDGDSVRDYAVASPANIASGGPAGPVSVYSGATGALIRTIGPSPIPPGFFVNDTFGRGLTNAGDIDGDGFDDMILGAAPYLGFPPVQSYEVHGYSGATGALISRQTQMPGFATFSPASHGAGFDVNNDGNRDWVVLLNPQAANSSVAWVMTHAGFPAGAVNVGPGCVVSVGAVPVLKTGGGGIVGAAGAPAFELLVSRATPGQSGVLVVGFSNTTFAGFTLPLDLAPFGLGCSLYNSADVVISFVTTQDGLFGFPAPLPANPALAGVAAYAQAFMLDPAGGVASSTNGLAIIVQ